MKRLAALTGILALALAGRLAPAQSLWAPDTAHSEVDFTILHLGLAHVHGRFGVANGTLTYNDADITRSTVNFVIDVASVDTGTAQRDTHLRSPDFFDAAQYPTASFVSSSVAKSANGLTVAGNLTLHGVTRPVTLEVSGPTGPLSGPDHRQHMGFSAATSVSRSAFNLGSKFPSAVVGDDVKLEIELDVIRQQ